jgi:hypothetical protein
VVVEEVIVGARVDSSPGKKRRMGFGRKKGRRSNLLVLFY